MPGKIRNIRKYVPKFGRISERRSLVDKVLLVKRKSKVLSNELIERQILKKQKDFFFLQREIVGLICNKTFWKPKLYVSPEKRIELIQLSSTVVWIQYLNLEIIKQDFQNLEGCACRSFCTHFPLTSATSYC